MPSRPFGSGRTIHLIGISGAEGSSVASFLLKQGYTNLVGHDHVPESGFRESFFRFHDWMTEEEKEASFTKLQDSGIRFHFEDTYLEGVVSRQSVVGSEDIPPAFAKASAGKPTPLVEGGRSDIIFVPQSWFRYGFNEPLRQYFQDDLKTKPEFQDRIWSMTKLYLALFPGKIIGVTGSNGKSTTTAMIAGILTEAVRGQRLAASSPVEQIKDLFPSTFYLLPSTRLFWGGNDRKNPQPLDAIENATEDDILLLEMSNRQLSLGLGKSPNVAVLTNVVPNHLDDHGTFEAYVRVKEEIVRYQTEKDTAVLNWNNAPSREAKNVTAGTVVFFDLNPEGKPVAEGFVGTRREDGELVSYDTSGERSVIASPEDIGVAGEHNMENALAAIAATAGFGVRPEAIQMALRSFGGLDHRLEPVAEKDGVKYINDSSGCSPLNIVMAVRTLLGNRRSASTPPSHSLRSFATSPWQGEDTRGLILIMGGYRKNPMPGEFLPVAEVVKDARINHLFLIGSVQEVLEKELRAGGVEAGKVTRCASLEEAFDAAKAMAETGDTVALTPGCESFGEFRDYRERGERFRGLVYSEH